MKALVERHTLETESRCSAAILNDWSRELGNFWQVVPRDYIAYLPMPLTEENAEIAAAGD